MQPGLPQSLQPGLPQMAQMGGGYAGMGMAPQQGIGVGGAPQYGGQQLQQQQPSVVLVSPGRAANAAMMGGQVGGVGGRPGPGTSGQGAGGAQ